MKEPARVKRAAREKPPARPPRRPRGRQLWLKAFIWIFIVIFLLGSVGAVALIAFH